MYLKMPPSGFIKVAREYIKKSHDIHNRLRKDNMNNPAKFMHTLVNDVNECTMFHSILSFFQFVSPNSDIRAASHNADNLLSDYIDELNQDPIMYSQLLKLKNMYHGDHEDTKFINRMIATYERNGVRLDHQKRNIFVRIKQEISNLEEHIVKTIGTQQPIVYLEKAEIDGLQEPFLKTLDMVNGKYVITLTKNVYTYCLHYLSQSSARQKVEAQFANQVDTFLTEIIQLIILRDKKAKILGYASFSDYQAKYQMAKNANNIRHFLLELLQKLDYRFYCEINTLLKIKGHDTKSSQSFLHSWDIPYYIQMWKEEYGVNMQEIQQYFEFNTTFNKIIRLFETMFGIKFVKQTKKYWADNVISFFVYRNQELLGQVFFDVLARKNKSRQMRCYTIQPGCQLPFGSDKYSLPIVALLASFTPSDNCIFLHHKDVVSLFHEFGHILQLILCRAKYSIHNGSNVDIEFVQTPSYVLDLLCWEHDIVKYLSEHYQTHKPLSDDMIDKIIQLKNLDIGLHYKKHIMVSLFDQYVYCSSEFIQLCEQNMAQGGPMSGYRKICKDLYRKIHNQIVCYDGDPENPMYQIHTDNQLLPPEWINYIVCHSGQYYANTWSRVISVDVYNEKLKDRTLTGRCCELAEHLFGYGASLDSKELLFKFMSRSPSLNSFLDMYCLEDDIQFSFFMDTEAIQHASTTIKSHKPKRKEPVEYSCDTDNTNHFSEIME